MSTVRPRLTLAHQVIFSLLPCLLFLGVGELLCRALGYPREQNRLVVRLGYAGCFFRTETDGSVVMCEPHPKAGEEVRFRPQKAKGACRVAVLGASSVRIPGTPYHFFAQRLQELDPRLEVLNLGIPGTNSAAVTTRALAALPYDVDVFLVYMGHNDLAQGVYMGGEDRTAIASLRALGPRVLLSRSALYRTAVAWLAPLDPVAHPEAQQTAECERQLYTAADQQVVADVLADNLERLVEGVAPRRVVAVVPVSNPGWPPTGSVVPASPSGSAALRGSLERGRVNLAEHRLAEARDAIQDALKEMPESALGYWYLSRIAASEGNVTEAVSAFARSRELDARPMRASPRIEQAVGQARAFRVVRLGERLPQTSGLPSSNLFFDTLHFSDAGHEAVAQALLPDVLAACDLSLTP